MSHDWQTLYGRETYEDVTADLRAKAATLHTGQLAKDPLFTLVNGVHALEVGSPKMDTGLYYRPLLQELEAAPEIEDCNDLLDVVDGMFAREMAWHTRTTMILQNVASSIHVESVLLQLLRLNDDNGAGMSRVETFLDQAQRPQTWLDVLLIYVLGTLKFVEQSVATMLDLSAVYPEEDVIFNSAGFYMLEDVPVDRIIKVLRSGIEWARTYDKYDMSQFVHRLQLRVHLLHIVSSHFVHQDEAQSHIRKALALVESSIEPRPDSPKFASTFGQGVQSRVPNTSPLRPVSTIELPYTALTHLLKDLQSVSALASVSRSTDLLSFFLRFSSIRDPPAASLTRGLLQRSTLKSNDSKLLGLPVAEWVRRDLAELTCPTGDSLAGPQPESLEKFMSQASLCYADLVSVLVQNRSRQRQNLAHCIISFDSLQVQAEALETETARPTMVTMADGTREPPLPISSWVYLRKLQIMIWVVLLGFELDIYKPWEYGRMHRYGYLLLSSATAHVQRISMVLAATPVKDTTEAANVRAAQGYIEALRVEFTCLEHMCQSTFALCVALQELGLLSGPPLAAASDELLYKLRFKPFSSVGLPRYLSFEEFEAETAAARNAPGGSLAAAGRTAQSARALVDRLLSLTARAEPELELLKRSTVGLSVGCSMVGRLQDEIRKDPKRFTVTVESKDYHWYFPVLVVGRSKSSS